jgi:hypothetical protein
MPKEGCTQKIGGKPAPYVHKTKPSVSKKEAPKTSAKSSVSQQHENLTLADWLPVFKFIDEHPGIPQTQVVNHFKTCREGALVFTQPTLSRKLEQCRDSDASDALTTALALMSHMSQNVTFFVPNISYNV